MSDRRIDAVDAAIVQAVAYGDLFDAAVSLDEIHRYLPAQQLTRAELERRLRGGGALGAHVSVGEDCYCLAGREALLHVDATRRARSRELWSRAENYAAIVASVPFVRMVGLTGSVAMDNAGDDADIDLFVVTKPGRLWAAHFFTIAFTKLDERLAQGVMCANMFRSESTMAVEFHDLYMAREIMQLVPLYDSAGVYPRMLEANPWISEFLPNAKGPPRPVRNVEPRYPRLKRAGEAVLGTRLGTKFEAWRRRVSARKARVKRPEPYFTRWSEEATEMPIFKPQEVMARYEASLERLRIEVEIDLAPGQARRATYR